MFADKMKKLLDDRQGNFASIAAIALVPVMLAGGMAVNYTALHNAKSRAQSAVDSAALGGLSLDGTMNKQRARELFFANADLDQHGNADQPGFEELGGGDWRVTAEVEVPMIFEGIFGMKNQTVTASAVVGLSGAVPPTDPPPVADERGCLITLSNSHDSYIQRSGTTINAPNCNSYHGSSRWHEQIQLSSGANVRLSTMCLAGGVHVDERNAAERAQPKPEIREYCSTPGDILWDTTRALFLSDDFEDVAEGPCMPGIPRELRASDAVGGRITLQPGRYCDDLAFTGSGYEIDMRPGLYVLDDSWTVNGQVLRGTGVSIHLNNEGDLQFKNDSMPVLTAPGTGPFAGLLLWERPI